MEGLNDLRLSPPFTLCIGFCLTSIGSIKMSRHLDQDRKQEIEVARVSPVPLSGDKDFPEPPADSPVHYGTWPHQQVHDY